jgi:ParB/RepB/Spo0J family partition protein
MARRVYTWSMDIDIQTNESWREVPLGEIGERFGRLRLSDPAAAKRMTESVRRFGQLSPVVLGVLENGAYELVDGFKRLRACRELGRPRVKARLLAGSGRVMKAAMITLNWHARSQSELEEALVLESLHREDGLSQVEIATLAGRHKSWVCRRIALAARLGEEALEHLRLGLLSAGNGRELARLPRGNQPAALATILKHRFTTRETARLVGLLLASPKWAHEKILRLPEEILDDRVPPRPAPAKPGEAGPLCRKLGELERQCRRLARELSREGCRPPAGDELPVALGAVERLARAVERIRLALPGGASF